MDAVGGVSSAVIAEYEALAERIRAGWAQVAMARATAESDDGLVSATVGARGDLVDLRIDPRVYRSPDSAALAATITATVRAARRNAERSAAASLTEVFGDLELDLDADPDADLYGADGDPAFAPALRQLRAGATGGTSWSR